MAVSLSPLIRFGTSSWTYQGWQGQVYKPPYSKSSFKRECLEEYGQYQYQGEPLFRTVGNDSGFCRPPTPDHLRRYLKQIPQDFDMCFKVWDQLTLPSFANHPRSGVWAGQPNVRFLDAQLFKDVILRPFREAQFEPHTGPFLFEFHRHGLSAEQFCERLDAFLSQLPIDFRYAVECRNTGLLCPRYRDTLAKHGVAHVYNHWSYMPPLLEQHQRMGTFTAPFTVLRLHTPLKISYEAAKQRAEPYTTIVEALPQMRRETVHVVRHAIGEGRRAYVLVNNRAEGNAPLTVQALADLLRA
ncbi:MAG: DUF72 domain-containing protein [Nitrospiraceae bacterium]